MENSTDTKEFLEKFVKAFIGKNRRARSLFELTKHNRRAEFINRLNHKIADTFDPRFLQAVTTADVTSIARKLAINDTALCYIISHDDSLDGRIIDFKTAFLKLYGNGLGFVIAPLILKGIYIEGEQENGAPPRYICVNNTPLLL